MYGEGYGEFSGDNNGASPPPRASAFIYRR